MQYKTIILEWLEAQPHLHRRLKTERRLLATVNAYAAQLRHRHLGWTATLPPPEALEMALRDVMQDLRREFTPDGEPELSIEDAMAVVRNRLPPA